MAEQKNNMTDRQLAEELQKGKRGGLGGRLLEILGVVVIAAGAVFGGSVPAIIAGALLAGIGEWLRRKSTGKADRLTMVWGDRIFEKCGIGRDERGDGGKTLEIRGKRRLPARDGGANYQQS